jgi:hypothetical protein
MRVHNHFVASLQLFCCGLATFSFFAAQRRGRQAMAYIGLIAIVPAPW